jgi:two-component system OmpR family response regulator
VLTARNQPDDVRQAITLGARDFLAKPFRDDQLLQRVGRLLRRAPSRPAKAPAPAEAPPPVPPPIDDGPQPFLL